MPHHIRARVERYLSATINRPIVDYEDFRLGDFKVADFFQKLTEALRFIEDRNND